MHLETLSITNISVRGSLEKSVNPTKVAEEKDKTPSSVTSDAVSYLQPMGWRIEIFYGGEFLISQASNRDEISNAKLFIEEELGLEIEEFNYHRATISGNLQLGRSSTKPKRIANLLESMSCISGLQYGDDNQFGGDLYFKLNSNTVRLFINQDEPLYSVAGIPVSSETSLSNDIREQKDTLESVLTGSCSE